MAAVVDVELCDACKTCEDACPQHSIEVVGEKAEVNPEECIDCAVCVDACPSGAISLKEG